MEEETRAEYNTLVLQVASWIMRANARDEYVPIAQLVKQFTDDVERAIG